MTAALPSRKQSGEETIKGNLPSQALQIDAIFTGDPLEALFESGAESEASCILSLGRH